MLCSSTTADVHVVFFMLTGNTVPVAKSDIRTSLSSRSDGAGIFIQAQIHSDFRCRLYLCITLTLEREWVQLVWWAVLWGGPKKQL